MAGRLLDLRPSELARIKGRELLQSIRTAEGRTIVCEVLCPVMPLCYDVTNAELVAGFGADLLLLNLYDVFNPTVFGVTPLEGESVIRALKRLTGRNIGINLEAIDVTAFQQEVMDAVPPGRVASRETARLAWQQGADFITLTGNPDTGVTNEQIVRSVREIRNELGGDMVLIAGKMHGAGIQSEMSERILSGQEVIRFIEAGADVIMVPAPGTVPGITIEFVHSVCLQAHKLGAMVMTSIGTSQEGADEYTIKNIALHCKMAGADMHHLGDSGYTGVAVPENVMTYSITIRGRRHTYRRMAMRI
ncbi:hypothetical protein P22_1668 [Propionispora sp. 2/2-37]|uniref:DUF7916 family protein n=1 Tax=Propionispora sp. 2/2-37 TaxID=1677858 RepID=UPI0006BB9383|nr:PEP phosphonomutase [Propionispora sp. 2/2-37]CUH95594.1 hypothetical protein P22_1668 [Propionispora sp. 2/2-37]